MSKTVGEAKKEAFDTRVEQCRKLTGGHCFPDYEIEPPPERAPMTYPLPGSLRTCRHCGLEHRLLWGVQ